eukprot:6201335-Pleurochrysis_carterae.AAC.4
MQVNTFSGELHVDSASMQHVSSSQLVKSTSRHLHCIFCAVCLVMESYVWYPEHAAALCAATVCGVAHLCAAVCSSA